MEFKGGKVKQLIYPVGKLVICSFSTYNLVYRPSGGTGIRARLKIVSRKGCGFDPHLGHSVFC